MTTFSATRPYAAFLATLIAVVALAACGKTTDPDPTASETTASSAADAPPPNPAIMDEPMDGSSVEAFEENLQAVREQAGQAAYDQLKRVIQYSMTYDLSIRGNKAKLYKRYDGKTPNEILQMPMR
ncbi:hypothetical protein F3N42_06995 [Marinihelvus fidelis]|uniref:Uncharacterized protein n=1 Tax=Marinihelvus fidelis TaxID=2613842 RepID=A0A5N0TA88_9GAMM|nr:hypothetical protein [Marinihelvus fidelis]KAA9131915.1 hypothetical protein F3N42_06995 [Marinihelvus fidelis]